MPTRASGIGAFVSASVTRPVIVLPSGRSSRRAISPDDGSVTSFHPMSPHREDSISRYALTDGVSPSNRARPSAPVFARTSKAESPRYAGRKSRIVASATGFLPESVASTISVTPFDSVIVFRSPAWQEGNSTDAKPAAEARNSTAAPRRRRRENVPSLALRVLGPSTASSNRSIARIDARRNGYVTVRSVAFEIGAPAASATVP